MNDASIKLRLPADLLARLRERAAEERRSVAAVLRIAAERYLDESGES